MVTTMASVKLVNGHVHHHPHHYSPLHHPLLRPNSSPEQAMIFDYSLPHRSRSTDYDPGSDSARDMSPSQSPERWEVQDHHGLSETPTKKNKRKLSEPKKRADFSVKRLCPSSPNLDVENVDVVSEQDNATAEESRTKGKRLVNGHGKHPPSSSKASSHAHSNSKSRRETSSSSSSASNNDSDNAKDHSASSLPSSMPSQFLHPMFAGLHPSALGYVQGIYFGSRPFPPGLHASFSSLPLHIQHNYIAATAAHASPSSTSLAAAATTSSLPSLSVPGNSSSNADSSASSVSNTFRSHQASPYVIINPTVPPPSSALQPTSSFQPSDIHCPGSSRTVMSNNEDDETLSSRAQSPEDLSLGGKLSRKHRKNYKNMTRERRVEANARERTRVHTISAAFDALRRAVPSYSHNQKLSKLAILRIACSYIMALARLADLDYTSASEHIGKALTFSECVDMCTNTIQTEGRARRRH